MKENKRFNFGRYKNAVITIEIQSIIPERFINLMWKNNIYIKNIKRTNVTTLIMEVKLQDYYKIADIAKKIGVKIKIIKRHGISFIMLKLKKNRMMIIGVILFIGIIYYMSTFIWEIQINSDSNLPPYEIRQKLKNYGVVTGVNKNKINVYKIEEFLIRNDDSLMWVKARIDGSRLLINVKERKVPPNIVSNNLPCDLIASKDGEVIRIFTTSGTAVVNVGDVVKKGQLLVKGVQGKEGETYPVHAAGKVICRTFYEKSKDVKVSTIKKKRTGNKIENYYININGRKLYLKKHINKFNKYDRIEESKLFLKKETIYELKDVEVKCNTEKIANDTAKELYKEISSNLDKSVKILNKVVDKKQDKLLEVRVYVLAEEDISLQVENREDIQEKNNGKSSDN